MPLFGTPGERIGYTVYTRPGAPPILLVHGFTASSASFAANVPALGERFEVITTDLLGHGASDAPADSPPYRPGAAVARLLALLDHLGHEKVLLCGHSLGAALCLRLALDAPQRLAGLILINSMSAAGTPEWREDARPGMETMAARLRSEGSDFLRQTRLYPAHSKRLDSQSRELLVDAFDAAAAEGLAGTGEALVIDVNSFERLSELAVPTLVVVGDRDKQFAEVAPAFIARMPGGLVREVHLQEAGHAANIEQPREFEAAVFAFAEELDYFRTAPSGLPAAAALVAQAKFARWGGALTAVGGALVVGGIALLVGSFFVSRGDGDSTSVAASADDATSTTTSLSLVAGTRSVGPSPVATSAADTPTPAPSSATPAETATTAVPATPANTAPTATPRPNSPATTTPTQAPTSTPEPTATVTPLPPTPTATTPPPTPTPSGARVSISGPGAAPLGSGVSFVASASGAAVIGQPRWTAGGGSVSTANVYAPVVTFSQSGCQAVSVTFTFTGGVQKTASTLVAVGGARC
ncbi:MAG: alpha/beta fold hydrolase [Tepidiformaceae bacterium]